MLSCCQFNENPDREHNLYQAISVILNIKINFYEHTPVSVQLQIRAGVIFMELVL